MVRGSALNASREIPRFSAPLFFAARDSQYLADQPTRLRHDYGALKSGGTQFYARRRRRNSRRRGAKTRFHKMHVAGMARCHARRPRGGTSFDGDDDVRDRRRRPHRVAHLQKIRDLQDETGGFTAFIPWTFQRENTALGRKITEEPTGIDYLKMLSVSRLFLDNIDHIQASWLTQGLKIGQAALRFGADDMGSIMIEENVVSAAGANTDANEKELRYQIRKAGYRPQQRDILYNYINREDVESVDKSESLGLKELNVAFAD